MLNHKALKGRMLATVYRSHHVTQHQNLMPCIALSIAEYTDKVMGHKFPIEWTAYALATAYHETAFTMQPIEEYGKGKGHDYGRPDAITGQAYYGRGYVQLTHKSNYQLFSGHALFAPNFLAADIDLVNDPELALVPWYALQIMFKGMAQGSFTGLSLAECTEWHDGETIFNPEKARKIINGTDKAETIAKYYGWFLEAIEYATSGYTVRQVLHNGDRHADVFELQYMLGLKHDGIFGKKTEEAVRAVQRENHLGNDGVCGSKTWAYLERREYGI